MWRGTGTARGTEETKAQPALEFAGLWCRERESGRTANFQVNGVREAQS